MALDGLSLFDSANLIKRFKEPRIHFLYFHHIFEDEKIPFDKLVARLSENHTFITHSEAVERLIMGDIDQPYITWSSDDGLKSNMDAAEILEKYGASCCFYVNPDSIGLTNYDEIKKFCAERLNMPPTEFMNWDDLRVLVDNGHEIGSHTMRHDSVNEMEIEAFKKDLKQSKEILQEHCGPIKHFAYPYGKYEYFTNEAFDAVFEMGYESCSTAVRGCHFTDSNGLAKEELFIRRDQIIAAWKGSHIDYFISQSVKNMAPENNLVPY
jgi:peptidoglycan/xylan/chitin deacetylase (PgdA/CDA1 family)